MLVENTFYGVKCDSCGTLLEGEYEGTAFFDEPYLSVMVAKESHWLVTNDGHHYCPLCHDVNDDDQWETKDGKHYTYDGDLINK